MIPKRDSKSTKFETYGSKEYHLIQRLLVIGGTLEHLKKLGVILFTLH